MIENNSEEKKTFDFYKEIEDEKVKVLYWEKEFNYFKGMRNNWFPLVLLEKMGAIESTSMTNRYQIAETFNILMGYAGFQSYYLDKYEKRGDTIRMLVKGRDAVMLEEMLKRVLCFYDLQCTYREKGVNKEEPKQEEKPQDISKLTVAQLKALLTEKW